MQALRHFLLALQFFTRVPVTGKLAAWVGYSPAMLRASSIYFPLVGSVVGLFAAFVLVLAAWLLPAGGSAYWLMAAFSTAASVWLTGGFHEDGLADTADALGGYVSADKALEIMKDSRIGSYGSLALILMLALKIGLLALLAQRFSIALTACILLWAHSLSRLAPLLLMHRLRHVGDLDKSKSKPLADAISLGQLARALIWPALLSALAIYYIPSGAWLLALVLLLLGTWRLGAWFVQRIGGFTGDTLGAAQQVTELLIYLGWAIFPALAAIGYSLWQTVLRLGGAA